MDADLLSDQFDVLNDKIDTGKPVKAWMFDITVKVTDAKKQIATLPLTLTVNP